MRVSDGKAARYTAALTPILDAARRGEAVPGAEYDRVVGKLSYTACLSRFGRAETRALYTQSGATGSGTKQQRRARAVQTSPELVQCLERWIDALASPAACGMTERSRWAAMPEEEALLHPFHLQRQDASGWGWGGRAGPRGVTSGHTSLEVVRAWTAAERTELSITLRELLAAVELFEHAAPRHANGRVLIESDNTGAVAIINNGGSTVPAANDMVRRVAAVCKAHNIEVRARHVPGTEMIDDGIDGLSRPGKGAPPSDPHNRAIWMAGRAHPSAVADPDDEAAQRTVCEDYKFRDFARYNRHHVHDIDACCDKRGLNAQPGCDHPFHADRPVQLHWRELIGRTVWMNPPYSDAESFIEALLRAYMMDPVNTRATLVLPVWETARWHQRWVSSGVLRHVHTYGERSRLFSQPAVPGQLTRHRYNSGDTRWQVAVYRLGGWAGDPLIEA